MMDCRCDADGQGLPPIGSKIAVQEITIERIQDGTIAERRVVSVCVGNRTLAHGAGSTGVATRFGLPTAGGSRP